MGLMTHVVAGYPNEKDCIELMRGMEQAGVKVVEVQIPFSDPIADGKTIMRANDAAIENGMTTAKSFELIDQANLKTDIFVMSYFQKVQAFGIDKFCRRAKAVGVRGLIIPDLPFDSPEYSEIVSSAKKCNLTFVPVVSPGVSDARLRAAVGPANEIIYLTSMKGITGKNLALSAQLTQTAKKIKTINPKARLAIGFGVSSKKDVNDILKIADLAVVGSVLIRKINKDGVKSVLKFVQGLV